MKISNSVKIKNPDWIQIKTDEKTIYGFDQLWYEKRFRKTAGCGPTTATTLVMYQNSLLSGPFVYENTSISSVLNVMNDVWKFVKPSIFGLNSTKKYVKGMNKFFKYYNLDWNCNELPVKKNHSVEEAIKFVEEGLLLDSPVAFLNLHAGTIKTFYGWHWIVIIGLEFINNEYIATAYDCSNQIKFNLVEWLNTTKIGGGFVYISPNKKEI